MRHTLCSAVIGAMTLGLTASGVFAQETDVDLVTFFGGQGCTIGAESRAEALAAGIAPDAIDAFQREVLAAGRARQEGAWVVLDAATCTIRLPDFDPVVSLGDADIAGLISASDEYPEDPGCFGQGVFHTLKQRDGWTPDLANQRYLEFLANGIILGDLRFYGSNPLRTPPGFQVMSGACGEAAGADEIRANHAYISDVHFDRYIRGIGSDTPCEDKGGGPIPMVIAAEIQGADLDNAAEAQAPANVWLSVEYDIISYAAGWHQGMSASSRGTPRPPLCTYGDG